jgi:hypothetical protein
MAWRGVFYGGPLDEQWRALQDPLSVIRVSSEGMVGTYEACYIANIAEGEWVLDYDWRGWKLQEVQESERTGIE